MTKEKKICPCCKKVYSAIPDGSLIRLGYNSTGQTIMTQFLECFDCWNLHETEDETPEEWEGQSAVEPVMRDAIIFIQDLLVMKDFASLFFYIGYGIGANPNNKTSFDITWVEFLDSMKIDSSLQKRFSTLFDQELRNK